MTTKIGINGFGRIGRAVMRAWIKQNKSDIEIVHINDLTAPSTLAHLLKYDSVHGNLTDIDIQTEDSQIKVAGKTVKISSEKDPKNIDWASSKVDIVFECTGIFRSKEQAMLHMDKTKNASVKNVLISAPGQNEDITVVFGVNHKDLNPAEHKVISNASCTTNCLAPVAKVINDEFKIENGLMTTIHAYTNDQQLLDLPHKDLRRARAAALSMIPTSTGAAKAIGLVLPELKGKIDGMAVRVPTPNVSIVDVTFKVEKSATSESVNAALKAASLGELKGVLGYTDDPLVSIDYNGNPHSSFVDGISTAVSGSMVKVLSWYDNETGFSYRMLDVARLLMS